MTTTAKPTLTLNQFAYWPQVQIVVAGILIATIFNSWVWRLDSGLIGVLFGGGSMIAIVFLAQARRTLTAHHLVIEGEDLVIRKRNKTIRRPLSSILSIEKLSTGSEYQIGFLDGRLVRNVKGAGAEEFVQELSRRSWIEIRRAKPL